MKTGILGGTFNPIHNGHIAIAQKALEEYALDRVLIMPSGVSYFKAGTGVLEADVRADMVRCAIEGIEGLILDDRETKREGNSYTFETLLELEALNPEDEFYYIIGADTLKSIVSWKNPEIIFKMCTLLCAVRDDANIETLSLIGDEYREKYNARVSFLHSGPIDISSTKIREMVSTGQNIDALVPEGVSRYIRDNNLYRL